MIGGDDPLALDFFPDEYEISSWCIVFALEVPGAHQENRFFTEFFHTYDPKGELPHGIAVGIAALVIIQGLLPTFGDTIGPNELEVFGLPIHFHEGRDITVVPICLLFQDGGADGSEIHVFLSGKC